MFKKRGRVVVCVEGIDGAGKSTVICEAAKKLGGVATIYNRCEKGVIAKRCLASSLTQRSHVVQALIYTLVAWNNYFKLDKHYEIILMDRCALSNVCYFFPRAVSSNILSRLVVILEPPLWPDAILILHELPEVAWLRCGKEKALNWLSHTNDHYECFVERAQFCGRPVARMSSTGVDERVEELIAAIERLKSMWP